MKILRNLLDYAGRMFSPGKRLGIFYPLFEATDAFFFTTGKTASGSVHIRDAINLKRLMSAVVLALVPCIIMAMYNTGYQAGLHADVQNLAGWRGSILALLNLQPDSTNILTCLITGSLYFVPLLAVCGLAGAFWEILFAVVRKEEINEGFFVTMFLIPLILPPGIPLWQAALGTSFGIVFGKEVFGGTGMNFLNPALTARVFLFFSYPGAMSGDAVWTVHADAITAATPLANLASGLPAGVNWLDACIGLIPGAMGETSALACLAGGVFLILSGAASPRIILSVCAGAIFTALGMNILAPHFSNPMLYVTPAWHMVLGGFAFGTMFMATDPVSAAVTPAGKIIYGLLIGTLVILIRTVNPAFPEGMMFAILLGNILAPLIDYMIITLHSAKRQRILHDRI